MNNKKIYFLCHCNKWVLQQNITFCSGCLKFLCKYCCQYQICTLQCKSCLSYYQQFTQFCGRCFTCPICSITLSIVIADSKYFLKCQYCWWDSLQMGIVTQKSDQILIKMMEKIRQRSQKQRNQFKSCYEYYKFFKQKEKKQDNLKKQATIQSIIKKQWNILKLQKMMIQKKIAEKSYLMQHNLDTTTLFQQQNEEQDQHDNLPGRSTLRAWKNKYCSFCLKILSKVTKQSNINRIDMSKIEEYFNLIAQIGTRNKVEGNFDFSILFVNKTNNNIMIEIIPFENIIDCKQKRFELPSVQYNSFVSKFLIKNENKIDDNIFFIFKVIALNSLNKSCEVLIKVQIQN